MDREKVIAGLKCIKGDLVLCVDCAYSDSNGHGTYSCKAFCVNDAIALLKEQEQMYYTLEHDWRMCRKLLKEQEPKQVEAEVINEIDRLYRCPSCHISMILRKQPYCHSCGQAVKWE